MENVGTNNTRQQVLLDHNVLMIQRAFCFITIAFIPFILITNTLVFWATILCSHFHSPMNIILFSLCVADLSMGLFCIPLSSLSYLDTTKDFIYRNKYLCLLRFVVIQVSGKGSLVNLLILTVDRYIANIWPIKYKSWITVKTTIVEVVLIWVYILVTAFLPIMGWNHYSPHGSSVERCYYLTVLPAEYRLIFGYGTVYVCVFLSFILHIILCINVYKRIRIFKNECRDMTEESIRAFEETVSAIPFTVILMFSFIILWLPYIVIEPFKYLKLITEVQKEILRVISQMLYFGNAVVNAPIYALARRDYRHTYILMLKTPPWKWKTELKHLDKRKLNPFDITSRQPFTYRQTTTCASFSEKRFSENPNLPFQSQNDEEASARVTSV